MKLKIRLIFIIIAVFFIDITVYAYTDYKVGDEVTYNGMEFYVIKNSDSTESSVTMLKKEPLTVAEVNLYGGVGTDHNHVNKYVTDDTTSDYYQKAYDWRNGGYGGMAYYSSETCREQDHSGDDCVYDYETSDIKYVVDAWASAKINSRDLNTDSTGYKVRIITYEELIINFGYRNPYPYSTQTTPSTNGITPSWIFNSKYFYWVMQPTGDITLEAWPEPASGRKTSIFRVVPDGCLDFDSIYNPRYSVRPVVTLMKTVLDGEDEGVIDNNPDEVLPDNKNSVDKKETTTKVKVENTYMSQTLIVMIIGFISICSGVVIYYLIKNKKIISRR